MANGERLLNLTKRKVATGVGTALTIGGTAAAALGFNAWQTEVKDNNFNKGAITRGLELDHNRPTQPEIQTAEDYIKGISRELAPVATDGFDEAKKGSDLLVSQSVEIAAVDQTLDTEANFRKDQNAFYDALGLEEVDDANIWQIAGGAASAVAGVATVSFTAGTAIASRRRTPSIKS